MVAFHKTVESLLNEHDVARITGLSVATSVRRWRLFRQGPKYLKLNSAVRYRPDDLAAWLANRPPGAGTRRVSKGCLRQRNPPVQAAGIEQRYWKPIRFQTL